MATIKSIEEKAKRYDEAVEKLRSLHDDYDTVSTLIDIKEELENIFPELKESEDEKMMNQLHSWMKEFGGAEEYTEKVYQWIKGLLEKQGEQKPADWIQELECKLSKATSEQLAEWKEKYFKVEPAEWSEEDEDILNTIINHFKVDIECTDEDDMVRWLKSLKDRVQPKQEWSEEDEQLYNDLSDTYFYNDEDYPEETYKRMLKRVLDWMNKRAKSLRPQNTWKPSESDILLLEGIANGKSNPQDFQASLGGLIEQLKKLREK